MFQYVFTGLVHPERAHVRISSGPLEVGFPDGTHIEVKYKISWAQINVLVNSEIERNIMDLRSIIEELVTAQVDFLGYKNGCGYQVEITSCMDVKKKTPIVFGVAVDEFHSEYQKAKDLPGFIENYHKEANLAFTIVPLRRALHDLTQAMRGPRDTGFYCFRSLETIRGHFKENDDEDEIFLWKKMGDFLNIDRSLSDYIREFAKPQRHGEIATMSDGQRIQILKYTRQVITRFIALLSKKEKLNSDDFPTLKHV